MTAGLPLLDDDEVVARVAAGELVRLDLGPAPVRLDVMKVLRARIVRQTKPRPVARTKRAKGAA